MEKRSRNTLIIIIIIIITIMPGAGQGSHWSANF